MRLIYWMQNRCLDLVENPKLREMAGMAMMLAFCAVPVYAGAAWVNAPLTSPVVALFALAFGVMVITFISGANSGEEFFDLLTLVAIAMVMVIAIPVLLSDTAKEIANTLPPTIIEKPGKLYVISDYGEWAERERQWAFFKQYWGDDHRKGDGFTELGKRTAREQAETRELFGNGDVFTLEARYDAWSERQGDILRRHLERQR